MRRTSSSPEPPGRSVPQPPSSTWGLAWVGFDTALAVGLALTGVAVLRREAWLDRAALATATLLAADAWFEVLTAGSVAAAALASAEALAVELPVAVLCLWVARRFTQPANTRERSFAMERFSPRLFAVGFTLGALGTAAVLAASAYARTPTQERGLGTGAEARGAQG